MHWERFNLCSLLSLQECGTGCTDPTSAAVQETTCEEQVETARRVWERKSYADVSLDRVNRFGIYALHLTTNVCMHRVWQALGVHYH